jgi:hypothetical protein
MMKIKIVSTLEGGHIHERFYIGEEGKTLALAGTLRYNVSYDADVNIWKLLIEMISLGRDIVNKHCPTINVEILGDTDVIGRLEKEEQDELQESKTS